MKNKFSKYLSPNNKSTVFIFVFVFAAIAAVLIYKTFAATSSTNFEAEKGTVSCPASIETDATASGGQDVQFGGCPSGILGLDESGKTIPDTNYAIPAGAIYMDPSGVDSTADGTSAKPFKTLNKAIAKVANGGTIVVRGGVYRDWYNNGAITPASQVLSSKGVTIQNAPHSQVWFDGADQVNSGWISDNAGHWYHKWDTPSFGAGHYYDATPKTNTHLGFPSNWNDATQSNDPQQVIFNGNYLPQVGTLAAVNSGNFYYDWNTHNMYIGANPSNQNVELYARPVALILGGTANHTLRGIGFRNYASAGGEQDLTGATIYIGGSGVRTIENIVITRSSTEGWHWSSPRPGSSLKHSVFAFNFGNGGGANGSGPSAARHSNDFLMETSIFNNNNVSQFGNTCSGACESAASKNANMNGATVRNSIFENTQGIRAHGLWFDVNNRDITMVNNVSHDNGKAGTNGAGIFYEISTDAIIASNLVYNNGGPGLRIAASERVKIYNNTLVDNYYGTWIFDDDRSGGVGWDTQGIEMANNIIEDNQRAINHFEGVATAPNTEPTQFFTVFDYNAYHKEDGSTQTIYRWTQGGDKNWHTPAELYTNTYFTSLSVFERHSNYVDGGADPYFVNKAAGNFNLRSGNPAGTGMALPTAIANAVGKAPGAILNRGAISWPGQ